LKHKPNGKFEKGEVFLEKKEKTNRTFYMLKIYNEKINLSLNLKNDYIVFKF